MCNGREFKLIDTGGIESIKSQDRFAPHIREQALLACEEADVIVFVVDGSTGVTDEDEDICFFTRKKCLLTNVWSKAILRFN